MVAESAFITTNNRVDAILALSESGRWAQSDAGPNTGAYSSAQWRADGSSVVTFSESFGSQGLRGRQVVWALKQSTPWTSNVLSWSCRSVDTDENGAEPASLPEFCRE